MLTPRLLVVVSPIRVVRSPRIDDALADEIKEFYQAGNKDASGRIFKGSVGAFRMAVKEANIELMQGQLTHVLRHTFANERREHLGASESAWPL